MKFLLTKLHKQMRERERESQASGLDSRLIAPLNQHGNQLGYSQAFFNVLQLPSFNGTLSFHMVYEKCMEHPTSGFQYNLFSSI